MLSIAPEDMAPLSVPLTNACLAAFIVEPELIPEEEKSMKAAVKRPTPTIPAFRPFSFLIGHSLRAAWVGSRWNSLPFSYALHFRHHLEDSLGRETAKPRVKYDMEQIDDRVRQHRDER